MAWCSIQSPIACTGNAGKLAAVESQGFTMWSLTGIHWV